MWSHDLVKVDGIWIQRESRFWHRRKVPLSGVNSSIRSGRGKRFKPHKKVKPKEKTDGRFLKSGEEKIRSYDFAPKIVVGLPEALVDVDEWICPRCGFVAPLFSSGPFFRVCLECAIER